MKVAALVLAVVATAVVALAFQHRAAAQEANLYARVASELAGRHVRVHCQGRIASLLDVGGNAGTVQFDAAGRPSDETRLTRATCSALRSFTRNPATPALDCVRAQRRCPADAFALVQAIHTLAHESWHLAGERDEARTECYALQSTDLVAVRLGADIGTARAIAVYAYERLLPSLPDRYRRSDCVNDGPLDLVPSSPSFP
jgi:hypothetical protein